MFALDTKTRRTTILASLARFLGPSAFDPVVYYESDWGSEEWTRGAVRMCERTVAAIIAQLRT
ncbi:hypothetical protein BJI47_07440 [Rhodococcus sp. 1168]|nr:hypothetical protein BJI47_07440 [Rhodococcus sp. 1168]